MVFCVLVFLCVCVCVWGGGARGGERESDLATFDSLASILVCVFLGGLDTCIYVYNL